MRENENETLFCRECGERMFLDENEVSHHVGDSRDGIDYDADADHVAIADIEDDMSPGVAEEGYRSPGTVTFPAVDMTVEDGTSGQDRESYSDEQDRDDYTVSDEEPDFTSPPIERLYQTTIVVWSRFDPTGEVETSDLIREAEVGDAYISRQQTVPVATPTLVADPEVSDGMLAFFEIDLGALPRPGDEEDCDDLCAAHHPDCDGFCDHWPGHRNGCWHTPGDRPGTPPARGVMRSRCLFCGTAITNDRGAWIDATDGDGCDNPTNAHQPEVVPATVRSDDGERIVATNIQPYLAQASDDDLLALAGEDNRFGPGEGTDPVAYFMEDHDPSVGSLLAYCTARTAAGEECGFSVQVEAAAARTWIATFRPDLDLDGD